MTLHRFGKDLVEIVLQHAAVGWSVQLGSKQDSYIIARTARLGGERRNLLSSRLGDTKDYVRSCHILLKAPYAGTLTAL
ncbi:hypothetical protein AJ88_21000 [Mesorhizobium amorphae CCBAU 01583]|nr:hypothetical protein AJ88_21000 [Mesorhizobium amorphae CCBAU 01583]